MDYLHKTEVKYTYAEYKKYNSKLSGLPWKISFWMLVIVGTFLSLLMIFQGNLTFGIPAIIIVSSLPIILNRRIAKEFNSNKSFKNNKIVYKFYPKHIKIEKEGSGDNHLNYNDIFKIIETRTNFYVMLSRNSGLIIIKENCSSDLIAFITRELK